MSVQCTAAAAEFSAACRDVLVIRDILGHSQVSVTANVYTHVLAPELREAIQRMDVLIGVHAEDDGDPDGTN